MLPTEVSERDSRQGRRIDLAPWVSVALTVLSITVLLRTPGITGEIITRKIVWPLTRLLGIMALSLSLSAVVEGMGWSSVVARLSRPMMRLGRLSDHSGAAFTTAFVSGVAANTLLWNAYQEDRMPKRELFLANLLNLGLPSYTLHLPTTFAIIVPLAGPAGLLYMGLTFLAALLRSVFVLVCGRVLLRPPAQECLPGTYCNHAGTDGGKTKKDAIVGLLRKYLSERLRRIAMYTVPIYILVVLLQQWGFFVWLQEESAALIRSSAIPVEGLSVVVFSIVAEFAAGAAAAGAMMEAGVLTVKETVIALLFGNVIATPVRSLRHQLPGYLGIFRPAMGAQIILLGQTLRIMSMIITGLFFYVVYDF
jgi:hypothetical protein